ncbi:MAG: phosphate/phosphite/phosphonate ABC transporter substrate-binding protein [Myxococcota bacterium]
MRLRAKAFLVILLLGVSLIAASCKQRPPEQEIGSADAPLVFVMSPSTVEGKQDQVDILKGVLEEESGLKMEIRIPPNPVSAIQLFSGREADAGLLGPFEYLLARKLHEVEAGLQIVRDGPTYQGTIMVKNDDEIGEIGDLQGKRIAYTTPYSMTGFVLPAARLKAAGVTMDALYAGSHDEALAMLEEGRVHAAATYLRREEGELDRRGLRVLETTGPVANEPIFFRKDLPADTREAFMSGFRAATADQQCGAALMDLVGCEGVAEVDDEAYDEFEEMASAAGKEVQSLVPGGWFVYHASREPFVTTP